MSDLDAMIVSHYGPAPLATRPADTGDADSSGVPIAGADEFHLGGRQATAAVGEALELGPDHRLLDIGCGFGGPARHFCARFGCEVVGLDLTPSFVEAAVALTQRAGLAGRVSFHLGSALDLPFEPETFDRVVMLHVGMNIADKVGLAHQIRRVLAPGGRFAIYDVMRTGEGEVDYPVAWASDARMSFVATPTEYRQACGEAGLTVVDERSLRDQVLAQLKAGAVSASVPPGPFGPSLLMGESAPLKLQNMRKAIEAEILAPILLVGHGG
ncbi:cyclopropane-fatty-acyl-phospholipid synthase family protein [Phenylobacterium sp.]|uniref:SAM-dependent methyltransferase n=1 Tax=Phenylobacterium sp. TaxID=1871053 RepID=UPI0035B1E554